MVHYFSKWISPIILAVICQQAIRLVTDISMDNTFWVTPSQHSVEFIISIPFYYFINWRIHVFQAENTYENKDKKGIIREYVLWAFLFLILINIYVIIAHRILNLPEYFRDYMFATVTCVPILLFYYTLIRNEHNKRKLDEQKLEFERLKTAQLETEMKFLKAQYHPHFLFNALNTIYFQVEETNISAKESIEFLSGLLRYQLYDAEEVVTLDDELQFLNTYISFQKLRIEEGIRVDFSEEIDDKKTKIHPLLFHPLLENAFKYVDGEFSIKIKISQQNNVIVFDIANTIVSYSASEQKTGIGLTNLKQRLSILYPNKHKLLIDSRQDIFTAALIIEVE
ncbi:MAG: histidine kinase [Dysgonomonas sp.]|nr:histidine kinase [Dysgonomonas sp.]